MLKPREGVGGQTAGRSVVPQRLQIVSNRLVDGIRTERACNVSGRQNIRSLPSEPVEKGIDRVLVPLE
eukprot:1621441-Pyramimonas_sp.AAC.1